MIEKEYIHLTLKLDNELDNTKRGILIKEIRNLGNKYSKVHIVNILYLLTFCLIKINVARS